MTYRKIIKKPDVNDEWWVNEYRENLLDTDKKELSNRRPSPILRQFREPSVPLAAQKQMRDSPSPPTPDLSITMPKETTKRLGKLPQ